MIKSDAELEQMTVMGEHAVAKDLSFIFTQPTIRYKVPILCILKTVVNLDMVMSI